MNYIVTEWKRDIVNGAVILKRNVRRGDEFIASVNIERKPDIGFIVTSGWHGKDEMIFARFDEAQSMAECLANEIGAFAP